MSRCVVCTGHLLDNDVVVLQPCGHSNFHPLCLSPALLGEEQGSCPSCSTPTAEVHWEIEAITCHRYRHKVACGGTYRPRSLQFKVVWKGFAPDTEPVWLDETELEQHATLLLRKYKHAKKELVI